MLIPSKNYDYETKQNDTTILSFDQQKVKNEAEKLKVSHFPKSKKQEGIKRSAIKTNKDREANSQSQNQKEIHCQKVIVCNHYTISNTVNYDQSTHTNIHNNPR